jgi:hypothetical protein
MVVTQLTLVVISLDCGLLPHLSRSVPYLTCGVTSPVVSPHLWCHFPSVCGSSLSTSECPEPFKHVSSYAQPSSSSGPSSGRVRCLTVSAHLMQVSFPQ